MTAYTVLYPGILSIRAIESEQKNDDKVWLTYWVMFAFLHVAETFFGFVFYFVPYWTLIRIGLFVYLLQFNGAETLYNSVVMDVIRKNQTLIKDFIARSQSVADKATKQATAEMTNPANLLKAAQVAQQVQSEITKQNS